MGGRKGAIAPTVVVDAVLLYNDEVVVTNSNGEKKVAVATDSVWCKISTYLNNRMSDRAIHTFVHKDRYNVKEKLGFPSPKPILVSRKFNTETQPSYETASTDSLSDCSSDEQKFMPTKKFVITFSADEWQQIKPQETIINRTLPCCLSFNRAKVYTNGSSYVNVIGRCTICNSLFKGIIEDMLPDNSRVLMQCTYSGNFNEAHKLLKKRSLIGPAMTKVNDSIFNVGLSCETYRESEAGRLMKIGNCEPAIIPTGNSLRALKCRKLANDRRHEDTFSSFAIMKMENEYINVIHDIGYDPFYVYYHCAEQIHIYRGYYNSTQIPKLIIDATDSVVKKFCKFGRKKTNSLYLYEALVYDSTKKVNFTVTNMVSEKHNNLCIPKWLLNWINSDIKKPKETVCDNSLALLSAVVQSFTQYTSLQVYIRICSDLLTRELSTNSHLVPWYFVRIDVAHFLKICTQWTPLKTVPRRVREIILRVIGLLIKCKTLTEAQSLLHSLFVVLVNETNGIDENGLEIPCEINSKILVEATSTGLVLFEQQLNDLLAAAERENEARNFLEEEYEGLNEYDNPFHSWADNIYNKSKSSIHEGSGINPLYLPTLAPYIIKRMKLLPLWSGIMITIFGYGDDISTSAAVESSFKKLKTVTLKHISILIDLEHFLENYIKSLKGAALLRSSCKNIVIFSSPQPCETIDDSHTFKSPTIISNNLNENQNMPIINNNVELQVELDDNQQTQSLQFIKIPPGNCTSEESRAQRKNNSYLNPNPHLRHLNISTAKNKQTLPILKNGSRFVELKSCKSREGNLILSNTCAFDALTALLMYNTQVFHYIEITTSTIIVVICVTCHVQAIERCRMEWIPNNKILNWVT
ncbi:hypothetical protein AGLY_017418 [Aphis glycines]|uniref:Uncharacterized protein n=1 Tax=Aphis glycines TaxID=307491 RepID=A0A6G0SVH5_APHGL|nr:hypothetical protein AGLY_017418 [Aphis glycines]